MIDIHAHILPGIDDGPDDWEGSLDLLRMAREDGIEGAVCTSHVLDQLNSVIEEKLTSKFAELQERVREAGMQFDLWLGSEIHCFSRFDVSSPLATIDGNGKYMLIEFSMGEVPAQPMNLFNHLISQGVTPILAHPERNTVLMQKPDLARTFVQGGVLLQVNSGSLTGVFGKRSQSAAFRMVDQGIVHFVASDGHGTHSRPMKMGDALLAVTDEWGEVTARALFKDNPRRAIAGEPIFFPQLSSEIDSGKKKGMLSKLGLFRKG